MLPEPPHERPNLADAGEKPASIERRRKLKCSFGTFGTRPGALGKQSDNLRLHQKDIIVQRGNIAVSVLVCAIRTSSCRTKLRYLNGGPLSSPGRRTMAGRVGSVIATSGGGVSKVTSIAATRTESIPKSRNRSPTR